MPRYVGHSVVQGLGNEASEHQICFTSFGDIVKHWYEGGFARSGV